MTDADVGAVLTPVDTGRFTAFVHPLCIHSAPVATRRYPSRHLLLLVRRLLLAGGRRLHSVCLTRYNVVIIVDTKAYVLLTTGCILDWREDRFILFVFVAGTSVRRLREQIRESQVRAVEMWCGCPGWGERRQLLKARLHIKGGGVAGLGHAGWVVAGLGHAE